MELLLRLCRRSTRSYHTMLSHERIPSPSLKRHSHVAPCAAPLVLLAALELDLGLVLQVVLKL